MDRSVPKIGEGCTCQLIVCHFEQDIFAIQLFFDFLISILFFMLM